MCLHKLKGYFQFTGCEAETHTVGWGYSLGDRKQDTDITVGLDNKYNQANHDHVITLGHIY